MHGRAEDGKEGLIHRPRDRVSCSLQSLDQERVGKEAGAVCSLIIQPADRFFVEVLTWKDMFTFGFEKLLWIAVYLYEEMRKRFVF